MLGLLLLPALLAACKPSTENAAGAPLSEFVIALDNRADSLDPLDAASVYTNHLAVNLYDTLYRYRYLARPYDLTPNLAADMPRVSADELTVTISLKPDTRFVDDPAFPDGLGRTVTAQDFVYSLQRHFDPANKSRGAWLWQDRIVGLDEWGQKGGNYDEPVEGLKALDDRTVEIQLTRPYPQLTHTLAQGFSAVVPREVVENPDYQLAHHAVGSGPYRQIEFNGSRIVMAKNLAWRHETFNRAAEGALPDHRLYKAMEPLEGRALPIIDRLTVEFIPDPAARWAAFISGQAQVIKVPGSQFGSVLSGRQPPSLADPFAAQYDFDAAQEAGLVFTHFNMADPEIGYHPDPDRQRRNQALRCAIMEAFDWRSRNDKFMSGLGAEFAGIIPPGQEAFDPDWPEHQQRYDPATARQRLADHGWTADNLPELVYGYQASPENEQMFEQFREFTLQAGYPVEKIKSRSFTSYGELARGSEHQQVNLVYMSWIMDYPDSGNLMQLFYGPNKAPGTNIANFDHPRYNDLYRQSIALPTGPQRNRWFSEMNQILVDECVTISGLSRTLLLMWDNRAIVQPDRSFLGGYYLRFAGWAERAQE